MGEPDQNPMQAERGAAEGSLHPSSDTSYIVPGGNTGTVVTTTVPAVGIVAVTSTLPTGGWGRDPDEDYIVTGWELVAVADDLRVFDPTADDAHLTGGRVLRVDVDARTITYAPVDEPEAVAVELEQIPASDAAERSSVVSPGWFADPSRIGSTRWWDGSAWTDHLRSASANAAASTSGSDDRVAAHAEATLLPGIGWYADPLNAGQVRWWDGSAWTAHTMPAQTQKTAVPEVPALGVAVAVPGALLGPSAAEPVEAASTAFPNEAAPTIVGRAELRRQREAAQGAVVGVVVASGTRAALRRQRETRTGRRRRPKDRWYLSPVVIGLLGAAVALGAVAWWTSTPVDTSLTEPSLRVIAPTGPNPNTAPGAPDAPDAVGADALVVDVRGVSLDGSSSAGVKTAPAAPRRAAAQPTPAPVVSPAAPAEPAVSVPGSSAKPEAAAPSPSANGAIG